MTSKATTLPDAVRAHVRAGMHLHFASTPSRANAALREVARLFHRNSPKFVLGTSGFHSSAHLAGLLGLGRRYVACFFGDNHPVPRPNPLWDRVRESAALEIWGLGSYVTALRAGALGNAWGVTRALAGSNLGAELAKAGRFVEVPDPSGEGTVGLVQAMRPDLAFVHGLFADEEGNVVFAPPYGEGFWSALGARHGVIVTVERLVSSSRCAAFPEAMRLPREKILAVCEAPQGTHPQPLFVPARFGMAGARDDFEHYRRWREMAATRDGFGRFVEEVLLARDGEQGYRSFVGLARLASLRGSEAMSTPESALDDSPANEAESLVLVAARAIAKRIRERGHRAVLAGIGHAFAAARLAKLELAREGVDVEVLVETGLEDIACGAEGDDFLLSHRTVEGARRHSSVDDVLLGRVCGAGNRCLGVIGAAEVDGDGNVNSVMSGGRLLVGPGGANDIASCASEVLVVSPARIDRLVGRVEHVTSPGRNVVGVATNRGVFWREDKASSWRFGDAPVSANDAGALVDALRSSCQWDWRASSSPSAGAFTTAERCALRSIDREGVHWADRRARAPARGGVDGARFDHRHRQLSAAPVAHE